MKNQPATAILGAALNASGYKVLHDYMRVHQPQLFRNWARRYAAAVTCEGKECVAQQLVSTWGKWPAIVKDDFLQRHRADKPKDVEFYAKFASADFLAQFPPTLHGCTPGQGQYWYEPLRGKHQDRPEYEVTVETELMGPRFLPGAKLTMQRVLHKREIQPGRVYYYWNGYCGNLFRVAQVQGRQVLTSYDGDFEDGAPALMTRALGNLFDKRHRGFKKLLVFVDYAGSGNPAKWALMNQLSAHVNRQVAARKQQEAEQHKKAAAAKRKAKEKAQKTQQQLADARRRIAELEAAAPTASFTPRQRPGTASRRQALAA